jgi:hypothetical protein
MTAIIFEALIPRTGRYGHCPGDIDRGQVGSAASKAITASDTMPFDLTLGHDEHPEPTACQSISSSAPGESSRWFTNIFNHRYVCL